MEEYLTRLEAAIPKRRQKLLQEFLIRRMLRRGTIDAATAEKLRAMDFAAFLDWLIENAPAILELLISLIAIFAVI